MNTEIFIHFDIYAYPIGLNLLVGTLKISFISGKTVCPVWRLQSLWNCTSHICEADSWGGSLPVFDGGQEREGISVMYESWRPPCENSRRKLRFLFQQILIFLVKCFNFSILLRISDFYSFLLDSLIYRNFVGTFVSFVFIYSCYTILSSIKLIIIYMVGPIFKCVSQCCML